MFLIIADYEGHKPLSINTVRTEKQAKALVATLKNDHGKPDAFYCPHPGGDIAFWHVDADTQSVIYDQETENAVKQEEGLKALRIERNKRLANTDWTQMPDAPLSVTEKEAWAIYRQSLRDFPAQIKDITHCVWPEVPHA